MKTSVDKLILGTVQMGMPYGINNLMGKIPREESMLILQYAFEQGIQYLDTAEAYGTAHEVIGQFHERFPEYLFRVITKFPQDLDKDPDQKVEQYRTELKVESLYALLFHSLSSYLENRKYEDIFMRLKMEGKIQNIGVSVYTNEEAEKVIQDENIDIIQLPYNILDNRNLRGGILQKAKDSNKIIHTRSCFLQGLFFKSPDSEEPVVKALRKELEMISNIAVRYNISIERLSLNYSLQEKLADQVLIGVDSLQHLQKNIVNAGYEIGIDVTQEVESIKIKNSILLNPSLWKML